MEAQRRANQTVELAGEGLRLALLEPEELHHRLRAKILMDRAGHGRGLDLQLHARLGHGPSQEPPHHDEEWDADDGDDGELPLCEEDHHERHHEHQAEANRLDHTRRERVFDHEDVGGEARQQIAAFGAIEVARIERLHFLEHRKANTAEQMRRDPGLDVVLSERRQASDEERQQETGHDPPEDLEAAGQQCLVDQVALGLGQHNAERDRQGHVDDDLGDLQLVGPQIRKEEADEEPYAAQRGRLHTFVPRLLDALDGPVECRA